MEKKLTPLMEQYYSIKEKHPDIILFFRLGDFYEMFDDDAKKASGILNITLTARNKTPMCGIPYHSSAGYIEKLLKSGNKIAICEQLESPSKDKKIVKRDVVRVVTPATVIEENYLDELDNNYLMCLLPIREINGIVLTVIDVSTGELRGTILKGSGILPNLKSELSKYKPKELIMPEYLLKDKKISKLTKEIETSISFLSKEDITNNSLIDQKVLDAVTAKLDDDYIKKGVVSILNYVTKNYRDVLIQLKQIQRYEPHNYVYLNENTITHLEIVENFYSRQRKYSLLDMLDKTMTPMGARMLKKWILEPLLDINLIKKRQKLINLFYNNNNLTTELRKILKNIQDIERTISRINCKVNIPRDLISLKNVLNLLPVIKSLFKDNNNSLFLEENFDTKLYETLLHNLGDFNDLAMLIEDAFVENPPNNLKDGNIIKDGFNEELDKLRNIRREGKSWLLKYEKEERQKTGVPTLRVKFNNVFGYFVEVSKSYKDSLPDSYIRVQTLTNAERFTTEKLKEYEIGLLKAESDAIKLENELYNHIRDIIKNSSKKLQLMIKSITLLDLFSNLAYIANNNNYICPEVTDDYDLVIKDGRHPVVEQIFKETDFVPNDTEFIYDNLHLYLITGPNMAGKSTYIRQVALIVLMAQMGSFVPASYAKIGVVDKIFTRIGSGDKLVKGESTFMVEMKETAEIIKESTDKSLVILDEVGRGTSTFDGISLAWVIVEELVKREWAQSSKGSKKSQGPRTLFATHYLELVELAEIYPTIKNFNLAVKEWKDEVVFLYKILPGISDKSYGLHVAKIAGVPIQMIEKAKTKLQELEKVTKKELSPEKIQNDSQLSFFIDSNSITEEIKNINPDEISPVSALLKIKEWQDQIKN